MKRYGNMQWGLMLGVATVIGADAAGQIVTNGTPYACTGIAEFARTNNASLDVTMRSLTCGLPTSMGQWFDLSLDPDLSCAYARLTCVDFSIWSSDNSGAQNIFVRVFEDTTPTLRGGQCGNANAPGPDTASLVSYPRIRVRRCSAHRMVTSSDALLVRAKSAIPVQA